MSSKFEALETEEKPYRLSVACIFLDQKTDQVLVGLRKDLRDEAWQFPQGGVDEGEGLEAALYREMEEELGTRDFQILKVYPDFLNYDFPAGLRSTLAQRYKGQKQKWFLCAFHDGAGPRLEEAQDDEFRAVEWVSPEMALKRVVSWKKSGYEKILSDFGLLASSGRRR
ncbi:MAG: RNA pyrophosphohydrolase [Oligoflexales bacterium]|nr:RNA pyrophosphohydrolase [Oligoflexales bacterium]